jgi:four helix bundle protein
MQDFRNLKVWEKAHALTLMVYRVTIKFPKPEIYGLTAQIRSSSASIATNIAEGCGRGSDPDFARFLQMAMGSVSETDYQLLLAHDLGYLDQAEYSKMNNQVDEIKRMLATLILKVRGPESGKYRVAENTEFSIDDLNLMAES